MVIDPQKRLWLFWPVILDNHWESAITKYKVSADYQKPGPPKWIEEKDLPPYVRNPALRPGKLVFAVGETTVADVFALYQYKDRTFSALTLSEWTDPQFEADFKSLYRYYKGTSLAKITRPGAASAIGVPSSFARSTPVC